MFARIDSYKDFILKNSLFIGVLGDT